MRYTDVSLPVTVAACPAAACDIDVLVVPAFEGEMPAAVAGLDGATGGQIGRAVGGREFTGEPFKVHVTPVTDPAWLPGRIMLVGAGPRAAYTADRARRVATTAALAARDRKLTRVAAVLPGVLSAAQEAQAVAEGLTLAAYYGEIYRSDPDKRPPSLALMVLCEPGLDSQDRAGVERAAARGYILAACCNLARALVNEPANSVTPRIFADIASHIGSDAGLVVDVLNEDRLAGLSMGMLLGVARGSEEPPRMVTLRYAPAQPASAAVLGLVGKGVTFDTGGISLKHSDRMHLMKSDMAGGAAVLAAMKAIAALKPDIRVVGVIPLVENMPGGRAIRPGDVVRSAEGKTVEVLDTDAEGRLILGDALWYARRLGATHLVDVATLTGAIGVALGVTTTGVFGAPDWWPELVARTANQAGDRSWVMPTFDDYREQLRSEIADLANIGGRPAGAITAAIFLKEFTAGLPWAHLDIGGTAWATEAQPYQPKGPTGVGVRTLAQLAFTSAEWRAATGDR